jgi:hypothetical protein
MTTEEEAILVKLEQPATLEKLFAILHPGGKAAQKETLHATLMRLRERGVAKFDINTGRWSRK